MHIQQVDKALITIFRTLIPPQIFHSPLSAKCDDPMVIIIIIIIIIITIIIMIMIIITMDIYA